MKPIEYVLWVRWKSGAQDSWVIQLSEREYEKIKGSLSGLCSPKCCGQTKEFVHANGGKLSINTDDIAAIMLFLRKAKVHIHYERDPDDFNPENPLEHPDQWENPLN